ncbi:MAG: carboxylesterase family protein [Metallibacterium scheffleri]|jgi:predicted peptidase
MRACCCWLLCLLAVLGTARAAGVTPADFLAARAPGVSGLPYRIYVPTPLPAHTRLPLIVFLHGSDQAGDDNVAQIEYDANGALELLDNAIAAHIPVLFAAPQSPTETWNPRQVMGVIRAIEARWPVDRGRVYLTGLSSGASGAWATAKAYPRAFAALVPMTGATELKGLARIARIPEWVFAAADDNDTNVVTGYGGAMLGSRPVVAALRAAGGRPCYTEYRHGPWPAPHVIWPEAYDTPALLDWLLAQRRGKPSPQPCPPDAHSR